MSDFAMMVDGDLNLHPKAAQHRENVGILTFLFLQLPDANARKSGRIHPVWPKIQIMMLQVQYRLTKILPLVIIQNPLPMDTGG
ncbi:hypothetical protein [Parasphingorhabdus sp.]|uniref:hypothetical protein n=1 Tax=Parasphingorhabdus sp. TaxID=2709688 RepID=UPI003A90FDB6